MIGKKLSPILSELEDTILAMHGMKPNYDNDALRASITILMSVLMDKMWDLQEHENIGQQQREEMAEKAGNELREFVIRYTNIDTHKLF